MGLPFRLYFDFRPPYHVPLFLNWTWHTLVVTLLKRNWVKFVNYQLIECIVVQCLLCIALCLMCDLFIDQLSISLCQLSLLWSLNVVFKVTHWDFNLRTCKNVFYNFLFWLLYLILDVCWKNNYTGSKIQV